jgi:hypothetical protein
MHPQRLLLDAVVYRLQKISRKLRVGTAVHTLRQLGVLRKRHLLDHLRVVKIALQHHHQIGETVHRVRFNKDSALPVLVEVSNAEGLYYPFHHLRLARQGEVLQEKPHALVYRQPIEINLVDVVLPHLTSKLVDVSDQLTDVGRVQLS